MDKDKSKTAMEPTRTEASIVTVVDAAVFDSDWL
jgi:hypothetical protein